MIVLGATYLQGETSEAFGISWVFYGGPLLIISSALSARVSKTYIAVASAVRRSVVFIGNVAIVATVSLLVPVLLVLLPGAS